MTAGPLATSGVWKITRVGGLWCGGRIQRRRGTKAFMKEETDGIYRNASIKPVVVGFVMVILLCLIAGWFFLRTGHPVMHTQPQPRNNKGSLSLPRALRVS